MAKTKKVLAFVLSVIMALSILPIIPLTSFAETEGLFYYEVEEGKATVTGLVDQNYSGEVIIPSTLDSYPVIAIGNSAFEGCTGLTSVAIPDSVTSIGNFAFCYCTGLTSIAIPDGITSINYGMFFGCTGLISVTIPDSVTSIGNNAFEYCSGLTEIKIPDSVKSVGNAAFDGCTGLKSVMIPNSVTSIGNSAFYGCTSLKTIKIPNSVISISDGAFWNCTGLVTVIIPDSITSIESYTFYGCTDLTSITIPDSVVSIGAGAFTDCENLTDVYYSGTEAQKSKIFIDTYYVGYENLLNANWHYDKYTIKYILNGGTNSKFNPSNYTVKSGSATFKNPTKTGYKFEGWYKDSAFKSKITTISKGTAKNVTVYAKWSKITYKLTYKLNGGKNGKNPASYNVTTATITLKNPTKKGYKFGGWYTDSKFKNKISKITKGTAKNITLYAKWSKVTYKITYKLNKGKNGKNPKTYTVTTKTFTLKNATRKGYTFKGWYNGSKKVTTIKKGSTGNITLTAKWKKK